MKEKYIQLSSYDRTQTHLSLSRCLRFLVELCSFYLFDAICVYKIHVYIKVDTTMYVFESNFK